MLIFRFNAYSYSVVGGVVGDLETGQPVLRHFVMKEAVLTHFEKESLIPFVVFAIPTPF